MSDEDKKKQMAILKEAVESAPLPEDPYLMNRLGNCGNRHQGKRKKVLCVCSAGLLRSPTAAVVLAQEYGYNTRSCGMFREFALIPMDEVLLTWADEIVTMESQHGKRVMQELDRLGLEGKTVIELGVPDKFGYMDEKLVELIKAHYSAAIAVDVAANEERGTVQ